MSIGTRNAASFRAHPRAREFFERRFVPEPNTGCWLWLGALNHGGYGMFSIRLAESTTTVGAHRAAYFIYRGEIPAGMQLDHLCRTRCCVNPWHLEVVTPRENTLRGTSPVAKNATKTSCVNGHELSEQNTWPSKRNGRVCKLCYYAARARYRQRKATSA